MATSASILAGLSFLVIGESHMLYDFREDISKALDQRGAAYVHVIGMCGASAGDWVKPRTVDCGAEKKGKEKSQVWNAKVSTRPIKQLIAEDKPDVVVVVIGDTMGSYDKPAFPRTWAWQGVSGLTKAIADTHTACVWVGPAYGNESGIYKKSDEKVVRLSRFLAQNVAPCSYVDSLAFSKPGQWRTTDGQHFNAEGYKAWSSAIVGALEAAPAVKAVQKKR